MSQDLKSRYYELLQEESMELAFNVFTELDHLILRHAPQKEILDVITRLKMVEPKLYDAMINDWKEGKFI